MTDDLSLPLTIGKHADYEWLAGDHSLADLLELCPEVVLGKYIAITSHDSGSFHPNDEEISDGWELRGGIAYSPKVTSVEALPRDGWDEWWVFEHPTDIGQLAPRERNPFVELYKGEIKAFVNMNLGLHRESIDDVIELFWKQFDWIQPLTYIAECGDYLTVVTSDRRLFEAVHQALDGLDE